MKFVEIIKTNSKHHKLTVNPNTGRITVKIANQGFDMSDMEGVLSRMVTNVVARESEFQPLTYRGYIKRSKDGLDCVLRTENQQHTAYVWGLT